VTLRSVSRLLAQHRLLVARGLALQSVACMLLSAYAFRPRLESMVHFRPTPGPQDYYNPAGPWLALAGGMALIAALLLSGEPTRLPWRAAARLDALWPRRVWVLLLPGVLMLLAVSEINGKLIGVKRLWTLSPHVQFALLLGGIVLVVLGLAGLPHFPSPDPSPAPESTPPAAERMAKTGSRRGAWREIALVLAITLLALGVRFWKLGESVRLMVDEGHFALGVTYFRMFPDVKLLEPMPTSASFPFIFSYGQAGMVAIFGRNFLGLRALSAVIGALTVPSLYLLTRELFDRLAACMAALVLLTFPPQVHYSRLALNNVADPLFGTLALAFLALATCYCNDIYREAAKRNIVVRSVQVEVTGEFGDAPGSPAENITYKAIVEAEAPRDDIADLMKHTDAVAEIQNSLRQATTVTLASVEAVSV
jgi:uncharacterized OsmC-like protein